jgi:uncharacterized C2H2 Zn-finger protein
MFKQLDKKRKMTPDINNYMEKSRHIAEHIKKRKLALQRDEVVEYEEDAAAYEVVAEDQYEEHLEPDVAHHEEIIADDPEPKFSIIYEDPAHNEIVVDYESEDRRFDDRMKQEELNLQDITNKLELDAIKQEQEVAGYQEYEVVSYQDHPDEMIVEEYLDEDDLIVEDYAEDEDSKVMTLLKCPICPSVFGNPTAFADHMAEAHTNKTPFSCGICKTRLSTEEKLRQHIKVYHVDKGDLLRCELCNYKSHIKRNYDKHVQRHYREKNTGQVGRFFNCPICPQSFRDCESAENHIRYMHG